MLNVLFYIVLWAAFVWVVGFLIAIYLAAKNQVRVRKDDVVLAALWPIALFVNRT